MKKAFYFAAACLMAIACGNKNNADVPEPPYVEAAGQIILEDEVFLPLPLSDEEEFHLKEVYFFSNDSYLGKGYVPLNNPQANAMTKGSLTVERNVYGHYTMKDKVYTFKDGDIKNIKLEIKDNNKFIISEGSKQTEVKGTFTPATPPSTPDEKAICAKWKISEIVAKIPSKSIDVNFTDKQGINPNDVEAIANYINGKAPQTIDMKKVEGYYISEISLSQTKVAVEFTTKPAIGGDWKPNLSTRTFSYTLDTTLDGKLFQGSATGSFDFKDGGNTLVITINAKAGSDSANIVITAKRV